MNWSCTVCVHLPDRCHHAPGRSPKIAGAVISLPFTADWSMRAPLQHLRLGFLRNAPQGNHEQHDHQPNVPVQPAFVDDLSTRLARMGYNVWDADFDVPVRTWYIDHATIRRWTAPRNLQLVGPPRGWEAQFSSLWMDQINPDEWFDVTVIYPDPPRTAGNSFIIMDLVVTQSLQMDRFPGLITVFSTHTPRCI